MFKVNKSVLFIIAGLIWLAAGVNILRIGVMSFWDMINSSPKVWLLLLLIGCALLVFVGFFFMFRKMVRRHKKRILGYAEEKVSVFLFMDVKGYLIMAFMMGLGIALRHSNLLPTEFFASFYSGLGSGLCIAGIQFLYIVFTLRRKSI